MGLTVHFEVLNQLGTPMMYSASLANQPAAGIAGRIFFRTDSPYGIYRDNGTSWDQIAGSGGGGVTGSGTATRVAFWDTASSISSNANLYWDNTNSRLGIGNASPGAPLDIHSTGTNAQFNGTGTNNAFLVFQNAGVNKWQIGNVYSTGANYFRIYDTVNAVERLKLENTGTLTTTTNITASAGSTGFQGIYNSNTVTIPAATTFGSGGYTYVGYNEYYSQSFGGSATYQNNNVNSAVFGLNRVDFSAAGGTVTMTQATGARAMAAAIFQMQYAGTNSGTITHVAGQEILGFYRSAGTGTLTVTNAYGLLINNIDDYGAGFTYTNRWGIFQQGSSDNNYFAGKIITGSSTTVSTYQLDVTGTARITGNVSLPNNTNLGLGANNVIAWDSNTLTTSYNFYYTITKIGSGDSGDMFGINWDGTKTVIALTRQTIINDQTSGSLPTTPQAILDVRSTTKGFLPPRMTTTQKNAISSPAAGLMVFDTTLAKLCVYSGSAWQTITSV